MPILHKYKEAVRRNSASATVKQGIIKHAKRINLSIQVSGKCVTGVIQIFKKRGIFANIEPVVLFQSFLSLVFLSLDSFRFA